MKDTVTTLSQEQGRLVTVRPEDKLITACEYIRKHDVGCVVVVDTDGLLAGIISERDIISKAHADGLDPRRVLVRDFMTTDVHWCSPGTPLPEVEAVMRKHRIRHVPIVQDGRAVGLISSRDVMAYQHDHAVAMQQAAERVARLSTHFRALDPKQIIDVLTQEAPDLLGAERAVFCYSELTPGKDPVLRTCRQKCPCPERELTVRGDAEEAFRELRPVGNGAPDICRHLCASGRNVLVPLAGAGHIFRDIDEVEHAEAYLCACGLPQTGNTSDTTLEYTCALLQEIYGINLSNAVIYEKYQQATQKYVTDALTGTGTRWVLEEKLESERLRVRRTGEDFCVAMVDVDGMKSVNDRFGHIVGDRVLGQIADCIDDEKRGSDTLARYGGDEFALLLPATSLEGARRMLARASERVRKLSIAGSPLLSVSAGVVSYEHSSPVSGMELLRRADVALYKAKQAGRDRVEFWDESMEVESGASVKESTR